LSCASASFLAGCSTIVGQKEQILKLDGVDITIDRPSGIAFMMQKNDSPLRVCRTPSPDVITGSGGGLSLGMSALGNIGYDSSHAATSLGGRSPLVLITNEFFYRACELTTNMNMDAKDTVSTYIMFLDKLVQISGYTDNKTIGTASTPNAVNSLGNKSNQFQKMPASSINGVQNYSSSTNTASPPTPNTPTNYNSQSGNAVANSSSKPTPATGDEAKALGILNSLGILPRQ